MTVPTLVKPAYFTHPDYNVTLGPEVTDLATIAGLPPDPEQALALDAMFAIDPTDRRTLSGNKATAAFAFAVVCARQNMKALATSTPLLTERGWKTMVDARVGDRVYHPAGHFVTITHVSDIKLGHQCYRVTATDGRSVVADAGHLWSVYDRRIGRSGADRIMTTQQMLDGGLDRSRHGRRATMTDGKRYATSEYRFQLPTQEPLKSADVVLPIDPYLVGAWLGDGTSKSGTLASHADDVHHWRTEIERAGFIPMDHVERTCTMIGITTAPGIGRQARSFVGALRRLGVLRNKHVPDQYLTAGTSQREALLQGLLDTDGTIHHRSGQVTFITTRRELADATLYLVRSLGWRAATQEGRALLNGRDCGPKFVVTFTPKTCDPFVPFRLARKAERIGTVDGGRGRFTVSIKSIEPVPSVAVCCIKVDSPDGLFLAGRDLMATHNTGLLKMASLGWLYVTHQALVVWSAHEMDTTREAFNDLINLIEDCPSLARRLAPGPTNGIFRGSGTEMIELAPGEYCRHGNRVNKPCEKCGGPADPVCPHGQRIKFKARTHGGGRGLTGNKVVLDEAMYLKKTHMGSLLPTLSAVDDPQLVYAGSAGLAESEVWRGVRDRGRKGGGEEEGGAKRGPKRRLAYMEFCSQPTPDDDGPGPCEEETCSHALEVEGCALDDIEYLRQSNPALDRRITVEYLLDERYELDPDEYGRERAGWWDKPEGVDEPLINAKMWGDLTDRLSEALDPVSFGVYVSSDRTKSAIGVVGRRTDGKLHVGIVNAVRGMKIDSLPGTLWLPGRLKELKESWNPSAVVIDGHSGAASLISAVEEKIGMDVTRSNSTDLVLACGNFYDAVKPDDKGVTHMRHRGATPLFRSVTSAKKRELTATDNWVWDRKDKDSDICQLMAVTLALHGLDPNPYDLLESVW